MQKVQRSGSFFRSFGPSAQHESNEPLAAFPIEMNIYTTYPAHTCSPDTKIKKANHEIRLKWMGPRKLTSPFFLYNQKQFLEMYPISIKKQTYCAKIRLKISPCLMEVWNNRGEGKKRKQKMFCFF